MRTRLAIVLVLALAAAAAAVSWYAGNTHAPVSGRGGWSVAQLLGADAAPGFERALAPRSFDFPRDHGPHPGFRQEWWYFTGNLEDATGRRFGYQLTFFRFGLSPRPPARASAWAGSDVYMAHFTVTDAVGRVFHAYERLSRAALGLAGAQRRPWQVWVDDWSLAGVGTDAAFPWRLRAADEQAAVDLWLEPAKPLVLQGERGLSRKSAAPGNASYYYSYTRLVTRGELRLGSERFQVTGASWMDREWSTSALGPDQVGWDWFALQLDDGRELMLYRLRRRDGSLDPYSRGTLVGVDGRARMLAPAAVRMEVLDTWRSPRSGTRYPARWRLVMAEAELELEIQPLVPDQELNLAVRYWEGAVDVAGRAAGRPLRGRGYVELTGYE